MNYSFYTQLPAYCLGVALICGSLARADDVYWIGGPGADAWNDDSNWQVADGAGNGPNFIPDVGFNDVAIVSNSGTVTLDAAAQNEVGEVRLGREVNEVSTEFGGGSLLIESGGSLTVTNNGTTSGSVFVGRVPTGGSSLGTTTTDAQQGALTITGTGSLSADGRFFLERRNNADTMLTLQDTASLTVGGDSDLRGTFRLTGPNVSYLSDTMQWGGQLRLVPEITGAAHSIISVTGAATLNANATIAPEFTSAQTGGEVYTLLTAATIDDRGILVDDSQAGLGNGLKLNAFVDNSGPSAALKLSVDEALKLNVSRTTGAVSVENVHGSAISIKGYSIASPSGSLSSGDGVWNSFEDSVADGGTWAEANPTANALSELNLTASHTFAASSSTAFGTPYTPDVSQFGVLQPDDLMLTYQTADGRTVSGIVEYSGRYNTLVLRIDPATGDAVITNESSITAEINGYSITSGDGAGGSGSLLTTWDSLDKQLVDTWEEANPSSEALNELNPDGSLLISAGQSISLDGVWDTSGLQDLAFDFSVIGVSGPVGGIVLYEAAPDGLPGDFNNDGTVDAIDYAVWRDNLGGDASALNGNGTGAATVVEADLALWRGNYGVSSGAAAQGATSAPEPGGSLLAALGIGVACRRRPRRWTRPL